MPDTSILPSPPGGASGPWAGIAVEALDCLQVNLVLAAARHHGPQVQLRLAQLPFFAPDLAAEPLPTVVAGGDDRLAQAESRLGLRVAERLDRPAAGQLLSRFADGREWYVVADAWHLPWVPYAGHQHMEHSFLVRAQDRQAAVVDGYHNDTPWGPARPGSWQLAMADLQAALLEGVTLAVRLEAGALGEEEPGAAPAGPEAVRRYVTAYRTHPDRREAMARLTLETWLISRSARLAALAGAVPGAEHRALRWKRLAEQAYLAHRRVESGRAEPPALLDALHEALSAEARPDAAATTAVQGSGDGDADTVRAAVDEVLGRVLGLAPSGVATLGRLADVPGFNSFRMVEVLESLESVLATQIPAEHLDPAALGDRNGLVGLFRKARGGRGAA